MNRFAAIRRKGYRPTLLSREESADTAWHQEAWIAGMDLFTRKWDVSHMKAKARSGMTDFHDLRLVPEADLAVLEDLEDQIRALHEAKAAFVFDRFRTWPIAGPQDMPVRPGIGRATKAEAMAQAKAGNAKS